VSLNRIYTVIIAAAIWLCYAHGAATAVYQPEIDTISMVPALKCINGAAFIRAGLTGKNIKIGIIDAGFDGADSDRRLTRFFQTNTLAGTRDFIYPGRNMLFGRQTDMDWHGTYVWNFIGGRDSSARYYGLAIDAVYYLARTDDNVKEYRKEEEYFKEALAWMHAQGVRVVNVSLGYTFGFDDPAENYAPENMDGNTAIITRAAREAALKYNMLLVAAAGNNGDNPWKVVSAPADASNVIAIGATNEYGTKRSFSAEGPDFLNYLKPNISCLNDTGGTSFSAPVISGVVACMLQKDPSLSNDRIISIIERSGHLYPYGNNYEGYGIPDAAVILKLMEDSSYKRGNARLVNARNDELQLTAGTDRKDWVLFHKKNNWIVLEQQQMRPDADKMLIKRPPPIARPKLIVEDKVKGIFHTDTTMEKVRRTTVVKGNEVIEIIWP
jgi:subtilisin family serine protease